MIEYHKVYNSQRIKGICECGHELTTMLNSERFGHTDTRRVGCEKPKATAVWIVDCDMFPAPFETKADHMTYEEKITAADTPFSGSGCDGCGYKINNELDFAAHFVIDNRRYLNLGNCPIKLGLSPVGNI